LKSNYQNNIIYMIYLPISAHQWENPPRTAIQGGFVPIVSHGGLVDLLCDW